MNAELRQKLDRAFDAKVIKPRSGPGGKPLSYVPAAEYILRLNSCFGDGWSFEITDKEMQDDHVIVQGRLVADGVIKAGLGGAELRRERDGQAMRLGDAFKSASSDCLKRCCRLWGIGLALYSIYPRSWVDRQRPVTACFRLTDSLVSGLQFSILDPQS